ncbi:hypothetical protein TNCV_3181811 [Trichonephila clavipes]|nr:hypothetical protein TNCV_3181811 [Trichonephila clavipes]
MGSGVCRQIWKWKIVNPDGPDQDNGTKLLNYCIVIDSSQANERYHICGEHESNCVTLWVASSCVTAWELRQLCEAALWSDGLVAFVVDRWRHD